MILRITIPLRDRPVEIRYFAVEVGDTAELTDEIGQKFVVSVLSDGQILKEIEKGEIDRGILHSVYHR